MKFDLEKIFNNAASTVITMIVVGGCVLVYNGATTVQEKVNNASSVLKKQDEYIESIIKALQEEVLSLKSKDNELVTVITEIKKSNENRSNFPFFNFNNYNTGSSYNEGEELNPIEESGSENEIFLSPQLPSTVQTQIPQVEEMPSNNFLEQRLLQDRPKW
jgi:hypothetical protein